MHRRMVLQRSRFHELVVDKRQKILDVGCGTGPFLVYFSSVGFQNLYGVEPDTALIKNIPEALKAGVASCTAEDMPYGDGVFDAVFVYGVLHHLKGREVYSSACREIHRVMKPGGFLFVMEPGRYRVFRMMEMMSQVLGHVSRTFRAFSSCLKEEEKEQHLFLKNHGVVRDHLLRLGFQKVVDDYFLHAYRVDSEPYHPLCII